MLTVTLRLYGFYKELFHQNEMQIQLMEGSRCKDIIKELIKKLSEKDTPYIQHVMFSNEHEILSLDYLIKPNDRIALLPPVSGG